MCAELLCMLSCTIIVGLLFWKSMLSEVLFSEQSRDEIL